ncbi:hypothetical protein Q5P01_026239 [Channa striata]|uniref:IF rod domain-containing protein n=1 Tax=Channa striata TaxID=64152 RepID=A0AA88IM57_CHASR|nr:hypothetical protein Q5P01_026239 [Channa striata]
MSFTRQSSSGSFSTHSISSSSAVSISQRMQHRGRSPSVYGGAGGFGTRISQYQPAFQQHQDAAVLRNEKLTMQNLNDRLASYMDAVRTLEGANRKLELQIIEFYEKKTTVVSQDFSHYFSIISELRDQIKKKSLENHRTLLHIDNAHLAAEDFKTKYEAELHLHLLVETDVSRFRALRDSLTLNITDLEFQIEQMTEELVELKKSHKEEMDELRIQQTGSVNVQVDSADSVDLMKVLNEMREQYEALMKKNKMEVEGWFKSKQESLQTKIVTQTTEVKTFGKERSDLKKDHQNLQITWNSANNEIQCLKMNLEEVSSRHSGQLSKLQATMTLLQEELRELKAAIETQKAEYTLLLDIKMRLEAEIAEYRRLLEGPAEERKEVVVVEKQVEQVEQVEHVEHVVKVKPHVEKRTKVIVEELIDGVVVSRSEEVKVEDVQ